MSSVNNATKVFSWASVASGKKKTQADIEAERAKERAKEREAQAQLNRAKLETVQTRNSFATLKRVPGLDVQNTARNAQLEKQEYAKYFTRENGHWDKSFPIKYDNYTCRVSGFERHRRLDVPRNVNERSMKFIEKMLANYPEVTTTCKTVGEFKEVFISAYMVYVKKYYTESRVNSSCETFAKFKKSISSVSNENETLSDQYYNLQGWVALEEGEYNSAQKELDKLGYGIHRTPPWIDQLWVFVKNVSFESCLWAINERSNTFEMDTKTGDKINTGFVRIIGSSVSDDSQLIWLTDLNSFESLPHNSKPDCRQKKEEKSRKDDYLWFD